MLYKKKKTGLMSPIKYTAMLFAAGLGTRLKPFTNNAPKALFPVNGKPLLQRNIEYLKSFGVERFVVNVHHYAEQIIAFLEENNSFEVEVVISDERGELLETGGGLLKAKDLIGEQTFLVMNTDILTDLKINELLQYHENEKPLVTLAVSDRESTRQLLFDDEMRLCGWQNLKNGEQILAQENHTQALAFSGIHVIEPHFFDKLTHRGKFSIIKPYLELMKTEKIIGFNHSGDKLLDVGKPHNAELAQKIFK